MIRGEEPLVMKRTVTFTVAAALAGMLAYSGGAIAARKLCDDGVSYPPCRDTGEEAQGNNLSFPAILADGFSIVEIGDALLTNEYDGPYDGLSDEEVAALLESGPWYAQKTEGNVWQADYLDNEEGMAAPVDFIDWGDSIESVDPKVGRPTRLELTLYQALDAPMDGYLMAMLANPSSPDEVQGTNGTTYLSSLATIASNQWKLVVQSCGDVRPEEPEELKLTWNSEEEAWDECGTPDRTSFAVELNVAGKYIFGASVGGWKPTAPDWYRITFYAVGDTDVIVDDGFTVVGNFPFTPTVETEADDGDEGAATPVVEGSLTYVDVQAVLGGGGGGGGGKNPNRPGGGNPNRP
jgi:hypothetical protein